MKIVIDTNVVISGTFFGGNPRKILESVVSHDLDASATTEIIGEYQEIVDEMIVRKQGHLRKDLLVPFINSLDLIEPVTTTDVCRDLDDNKFLSCAKDSDSLYIVSGDKDLLELHTFEGIQIITAKNFVEMYLNT